MLASELVTAAFTDGGRNTPVPRVLLPNVVHIAGPVRTLMRGVALSLLADGLPLMRRTGTMFKCRYRVYAVSVEAPAAVEERS